MDQKPLISYVVTAYNIEEYIGEAVQCAFAQTYSPLELVLSDDCSTDKTFKIMQQMASEYKGPHKIVLNRNTENLGITKHMNKAFLQLSSGEIIVVAHGDDISSSDRTSKMAEYLENNHHCTQVACSAVAVRADKTPLSDYVQKTFQVDKEHIYSFGSGAHVSIGFSAFRRIIMDFFGPLSDSCPTEDDPVGFRAILLGEIALLPDKMIQYRKHEKSNSNPDQFDRFPLDEIYYQNIRDMEYAVSKGLITETQARVEKERLFRSKEIRKAYREYFSKRTISSWVQLVFYKDMPIRRRLHYIKEHFEYLIGHHE